LWLFVDGRAQTAGATVRTPITLDVISAAWCDDEGPVGVVSASSQKKSRQMMQTLP